MLKKINLKKETRNFTRKKPKYAFSLIELLIVISLIGIMTFLGMPYFRTFLDYSSLKNDAWKLIADLRSSRQLAIVEHVNYQFVFDVNLNSYRIEKRDAATNALLQTQAAVFLKNNITQAVDVAFRPKGEASTTSNIVVQGENPKEKITITVYATTGLVKFAE